MTRYRDKKTGEEVHVKRVICEWERRDHYGRPLARCSAAGADLSCAMLASGHAAARYSKLECGR